jgi:hypothetical protein
MNISQALTSLVPGASWGLPGDEVFSNLEWHDTTQTQPTEVEITAEITRLQAEYDANAYARSRATAYPSLQDQADMQFHDAVDGTTTWQDAIQAVKDANPKP